jgi:plastocyanin
MHFSSQLIALASIAASASAVSHQVAVGESGLVYTPNTTIAAVGDKVVFSFYPRAHNVVQGPYDTPCKSNSTSAIYSGFIPSSAGVAVCFLLTYSFPVHTDSALTESNLRDNHQ